jgi:TonB-linked SusC/RagA family outer membrane protein
MRALSTVCLFLLLVVPSPLLSQEGATGTITGVVTSETGQPLASAQVSIPGTRRGAVTRSDGRYLIAGIPVGQHQVRATLIGYAAQQQPVDVAAGTTATLNFQLVHTAVELEAIVAVGYGVQHRQEVTGSVASVSVERLENVPNTTVMQALQGAAPGVNVTTTSTGAEPNFNILIRGQNSITASNEPLIVVDGFPYNGNIAEINQTDIASIDILRDASAAAIYGARGANGVVLITTKRGTVGAPRFTYEGYVGMQEATRLPRILSGTEFAAFKCEHMWNSNQVPCEEALDQTERNILASGQYTDWYNLALRRGTQQQHTLSLSGGSEDTRFYVSGSLLDTEGIAVNDAFRRYTLRANLEHNIGAWMDAGLNTQISYADRSGRPASFSGAFYANPLIPAYEEDGSVAITPWPEDPERTNPLQNLNIIDDDISRRTLASGFAEARFPFLEGLSFRVNGGVDFLTHDMGSYWGRNTRVGLSNQGRAITESRRAFDWTVENILRFNRQFGLHSVDLTGLYAAQGFDLEGNRLVAEGFPNDVLTYRQSNIARSLAPEHRVEESGILSQMGRLHYGYDTRYMLTLTARRDGYSGFGTNYKYGVFPSVALAWNVSNEPFWGFDRFNELRLRFSYGQNGNHAIRPYQTLARLGERSYIAAGSDTWPGFVPASLANPDLRWEATTAMNGGVDFRLLANRLRGSVDVYSSLTTDLLLERLVSPVHGIERMVENVGSVRNRGLELSLGGVPLEMSRFSWSADFNVSANRNRIVNLYGDFTDDLVNEWFIGQPIRVHYGWVFDGVWQETDDIANSHQPNARSGDVRIRDLNGDGRIDADDRTFLGTPDPDYIIGLSNTLRYGSVSLNFFVHAVQGVTLYNNDFLADPQGERVRRNVLYFNDWWTPENQSQTRWANRQGANPLHAGLRQDASFIRLRDMTLSYDLPPALTGRVGASGLRIFANGRNLWTHTSWPLLDPEISPELDAGPPPRPGAGTSEQTGFANQRQIPMERIFSIGVNASF